VCVGEGWQGGGCVESGRREVCCLAGSCSWITPPPPPPPRPPHRSGLEGADAAGQGGEGDGGLVHRQREGKTGTEDVIVGAGCPVGMHSIIDETVLFWERSAPVVLPCDV